MALVNFDGIPGPTHNYAGLARGNLAAERNARRADIGGEGEDLRQRDGTAERMGVVDRELAIAQRAARVIERIQVGFA